MIPNSIIEAVLDHVDIVEVIGDFVQLKKKGSNFAGLSPFTNEKNPSFIVSPAKKIFTCFSSGKSGGVVKFLKLHKGMLFPESIKYLADKYGFEIPESGSLSNEEQGKQKIREELFNLNEFAASYFQQALTLSQEAADYVNQRIPADYQTEFMIGFANGDWHGFQEAATEAGYPESLLLLSGLVTKNDSDHKYDFFRNRVIFPIHNHLGRLSAFAGRTLDDTQPKYLNITNTPVFTKSSTLFGLFLAQGSIRKLDCSILVEGYTDVISLHGAGILNAVAPCGTALTGEQCLLLARYSKHVVLMYDGDEPGQNAAVKNARIALESGLLPFVIELPKEEDPDSFVRKNPDLHLTDFITAQKTAFPLWYADRLFTHTVHDPVLRNESLKQICSVLSLYSEDSLVTFFVEAISKKFKIIRSLFFDRLKEAALLSSDSVSNTDVKLPPHVDPKEFQTWGFYEDHNQYYFDTKDGIRRFSNFIMKPLFHVESAIDARRIFELTNFAGHKVTIDFDMNEMTSIINFRRITEGKGNFIFWGLDHHLTKLKMRWYEETRTCTEIRTLGWQKEGFWAWANGISTESGFQETDQTGLVVYDDRHYFIQAFSNIYINDKSLFLDERKFIYIKKDFTIQKWSALFIDVFGVNAKFATAFYIATLFRDHILQLFSNFPILNLFGPKGTGKSQMAMSLSCLFGKQQTPFNIHNGTKAGLAEHIQQFINGFAWIDEYKNNIEYDKIETLKSIYDAIGRNRLNYDKGKKKETTLVNSAVILSGQEMPTADVALFSRVIFLQFHKTEYSSEEKKNYDLLKSTEKQGLSCITAEIIKHRHYFIENYSEHYEIVLKDLFAELNETIVEDRILRSWCAIMAGIRVLAKKLELPFSYEDTKSEALKLIINQNSQIASSDEIAAFWDLFEAMFDNNILIDKWHFLIAHTSSFVTHTRPVVLDRPTDVLKIKFNSIYKIYSEHARRDGIKALPSSTLKYYLEKSKHFLGIEKSTKFYRKDYSSAEGRAIDSKQVTTSYCFDYNALNINLVRSLDTEIESTFL